jgi:hypothetical protein
MLSECLGASSMRLVVPFIAPRQLGAVGGQQGRLSLPCVGWCTGQPLFMSGARSPSYSGADDRCRDVSVGAPDTVRCPMPTVGAGHASPVDCVANRCAGSRWLTGQSGAPPDSPMHHRTVRCIIVVRRQTFPRAACSPESSLAHRTLSGAPPDSPMC